VCAIAYLGGLLTGIVIAIIASIIASVISYRKGIEFRKKKAEAKIGSAEQEAERIISELKKLRKLKKGKYCLRQRKRFIKAGWSSIEKLRKEEMKSSVWREDLFKRKRLLTEKSNPWNKKKNFLIKDEEIQELYEQTLETQDNRWPSLKEYPGCLLTRQKKSC